MDFHNDALCDEYCFHLFSTSDPFLTTGFQSFAGHMAFFVSSSVNEPYMNV